MKVSVIIPTYNRRTLVRKAIVGALGQTHRDLEVIVVDDGSTDGTAEALAEFGGRITVIRQDNAGPSAARNHGVLRSSGEIIAFLDSDDDWLPTKVEKQVAALTRWPEAACCVCNARRLLAAGKVDRNAFARAGLPSGGFVGLWTNPAQVLAERFLLFNQCAAIRRSALDRVGLFEPRFRLLEDHHLALRLADEGPWVLLGEELVVKDDGTEGIGNLALRDHAAHLQAVIAVYEDLLRRAWSRDDHARRVANNLRRLRRHHWALGVAGRPDPLQSTFGRLFLLTSRKLEALARRFPNATRPEIVFS